VLQVLLLIRSSPNYPKRQLLAVPGGCPFRKLIRHTIKPPTVRNDDVGRRLLVIVLPFQVLAVAQIAIQDYPFPVTGVCASDDNN
jgi:hypothetical protein